MPRVRIVHTLVRLALVAVALYALHRGSGALLAQLDLSGWGGWALLLGVLIYALALAIPFVPGVELGLGLMAMFGRPGVLVVYGGTLLGLSLAYAVGRRVPLSALAGFAGWLRLPRLAGHLRRLGAAEASQAMAEVESLAPRRFGPVLTRHRYLLLAVAINLPGNALIGGGGGIAMLAGISRRFRYPLFLAVCVLAVAPVPLLFLIDWS